jgi:hypothetical protein
MSSIFEQNAVHLQSGNPNSENAAALHAPGTLGARFTVQHPVSRASSATPPRAKRYQIVQLDSTAAASLAGSPAYWTDRANYKVTGVGSTFLNQVAGVFNNAVTPGYYTCIQIGCAASVRASDANVAAAVAGTDAVVGGATNLAVLVAGGTAPGYIPIGSIASPKTTDTTGGTGNHRILVDLLLPETV